LAAALVLVAIPRPALAGARGVAVLDGDPALLRALALALAPWRVDAHRLEAPSPGPSMPAALVRARTLAREHGFDAVIWISLAEDGFTLWVYDLASDRTSARALVKPPPFDEETAAGIALSLKTLLRTTEVAPPRDRFGSEESRRPPPTWLAYVGLGAAGRVGVAAPVEPLVEISAAVWPSFVAQRLGLRLDVRAGTGAPARQSSFRGTAYAGAVDVALALRVPLGGDFTLEPGLGAGVYFVALDGFVMGDDIGVGAHRVTPAVMPSLSLDGAIFGGRVRLGPTIGLTCLYGTYRFLVHGEPVLDVAPIALHGSLRVGFALD
jgi:hypothetical protein